MCIDRVKHEQKTACEAVCQAGAIKTGIVQEIVDLQARKAIERIKESASAAQAVSQGDLGSRSKGDSEKI